MNKSTGDIFSIVTRLAYFADSQPETPALIDRGRTLSYGELWQRIKTAAAWLHQCGVRPGDTVAVSLDASAENAISALQCIYALAYLGAVTLPLYPGTPSAAALFLTDRFGARYWLVGGGPRPATSAALLALRDSDARESAGQYVLPPRGDEQERACIYQFTSATTGTAKAVLFAVEQFSAWVGSFSAPYGSTAQDRQVGAQPWPFKVGMRDLFRIHHVGGTFVNVAFPETRLELVNLIQEFGVTQLNASPWQVRRLLASPTVPHMHLPALRVLTVGGAAMFPQELLASRATLTPNTYVGYGTNELGLVTCLRPEEPADVPGGVGKPNPRVEAQVVDEAGQPLPAGIVGTLRFRTPWMSQRYVHNEEATARNFRGGWFYPNDLALIDGDGSIVLRGRTDDIINFGGTKIEPGDVELVLMQHPNIVDAAVVGVPDVMAGQIPVGFIVTRGSISIPALCEFCAERIERWKLPQRWAVVGQLPRNADGKILRGQLSAAYSPRPSGVGEQI